MTTAAPPAPHLLGLDGLPAEDILSIIDRADELLGVANGTKPPMTTLAGKVVVNLFLEDSTRTRSSFHLAAFRLGAHPLDFTAHASSMAKGETPLDTALTIEAMGVDAMVVRAKDAGVPIQFSRALECPIINAGDGRHEHPTQGLLDIMVMRRHLGDLAGKHVAIVGDIGASRVARSNLFGLTTLGATVHLVGPPELLPVEFAELANSPGAVELHHELDSLLPGIDAIMMLRIQFERGSTIGADYRDQFALTLERARKLPGHAIVMHPGPMNRGTEIDTDVADDPERSVILEQVEAGVAVRMAVLLRAMQ
jgi:aspartate carbamoyltransferase catalytic subunit